VTEPLELGDTRPKRKKLDARKGPASCWADPCREGLYSPRIDKEANHRTRCPYRVWNMELLVGCMNVVVGIPRSGHVGGSCRPPHHGLNTHGEPAPLGLLGARAAAPLSVSP